MAAAPESPVLDQTAVVTTQRCGDACPILPGKRYVECSLGDAGRAGLDDVRPIRDEIDPAIRILLDELSVLVAR